MLNKTGKAMLKPLRTSTAQEVNGKTYDLVVFGGMLANVLKQWDALYGGQRAPILTNTQSSSRITTATFTARPRRNINSPGSRRRIIR